MCCRSVCTFIIWASLYPGFEKRELASGICFFLWWSRNPDQDQDQNHDSYV